MPPASTPVLPLLRVRCRCGDYYCDNCDNCDNCDYCYYYDYCEPAEAPKSISGASQWRPLAGGGECSSMSQRKAPREQTYFGRGFSDLFWAGADPFRTLGGGVCSSVP